MDPTELAFAGIARQAKLIRDGDVSSRELTELCLDRIERLNPALNAFTAVLAERALDEADEADRARDPDRPLRGVPLAVKDVEDVEGVVTGFGSGAFEQPAAADGPLVRRLRAAGASDRRQDRAARARDLRLHRVRALGRDPQPLGPRAQHGRLVGRQRRGGRGRAGRRRDRVRRRRLDPDPGGVLRPVRPQAAASAASVQPSRPLVGDVGARVPDAVGPRHGALP